jgi:hypothetical protein
MGKLSELTVIKTIPIGMQDLYRLILVNKMNVAKTIYNNSGIRCYLTGRFYHPDDRNIPYAYHYYNAKDPIICFWSIPSKTIGGEDGL